MRFLTHLLFTHHVNMKLQPEFCGKRKHMKKNSLWFLVFIALFTGFYKGQNPGLIISKIHPNPAGTDSCKEFVELKVAQNINFALTPYSVIVSNNGSAAANGWIAGGGLSYAFEINSGTVNQGDVVYVGGSCMTPVLNRVRVINVKTTGGDGGIGTANASGVFGNGGSNADGVAVFNMAVAAITPTTVPVDAVHYGTAIGTATAATGGYQLPVNDLYAGGKISSTSFFATDPAGDILTATGAFNISTNAWGMNRTFSVTPIASLTAVSSVSLTTSASPAVISFFSNDTTVLESAGTATVYARLTSTSSALSSVNVTVSGFSNAGTSDYTLATTTVSFAANAPVNTLAPIVFNINDDALTESSEYIVLRFGSTVNATIGSNTLCAVYIKDNDKPIPAPSNAITLNLLSSFSNSVTGSNSAEIVAHDPSTQRLYIANSIGSKLDIINFVNPSAPVLLNSISISSIGGINSVAVRNGTVACAIENGTNPQDSGKVAFFDKDGVFLKDVKVGAMPDMIVFNNAGTRVLTANEGEPNATYTNDPDGSVSIIDISGGIAGLNQSHVSAVTFTAYNGSETALKAQGVRIYGVSGQASKDFEPEYIAISKDDTKAWVTLQENNAVVEINLATNSINNIRALGSKDHSLLANGMDVSNTTKEINISNFPVKGFYLPDAIASYTIGGVNYYITANEGDARAFSGLNEESRISALNLDPVKFPYAAEMKHNSLMGRLLATSKSGDTDNDMDIDTIYCYGSRSFSIWNGNTGALVYDSKDDIEQITASNSFSVMFNASNTSATRKDRSDDKGPEPEGVSIGQIGNNVYAFIALERVGGVMVYDVTNPNAPVFVTYANNRTLPLNGPDRGAEGIIFIPQSQSPNGQHIVIAANEVSSTLSIWGIAGCASPLSSSLSVAGNTVACAAQSPTLSVPAKAGASYQWYNNAVAVAGATLNTLVPAASGNYSVSISTGSNCSTTSLTQTVTVLPAPVLSVTPVNTSVCAGQSLTLSVSGAVSYTWNTGAATAAVVLTPSATSVYSVLAIGANGCNGSTQQTVTVNALPVVSVTPSAATICVGQSASLTASGAASYTWNTGSNAASIVVNTTLTTTYTVAGTDANGCLDPVTAITLNVSQCLGISESDVLSGKLKIYPNPTTGTFYIQSEQVIKQVRLFNTMGQQVYQNQEPLRDGRIVTEHLVKGIYFVEVETTNGQLHSQKLIVE